MPIDKFMEDWKALALGTPQVPALTTEFLYDWATINAWFDQHPEVHRDSVIEAIRGGFKPIYPVSVGDGDWKPATQPVTLSMGFEFAPEDLEIKPVADIDAVNVPRIVNVRTTTGWMRTFMSSVKKGDVICMFEPDGTPVLLKGSSLMIATGDAHLAVNSDCNHVWSVLCDPYTDQPEEVAGAGCGDGVTGD